mgnify:CR=1 FL=1
MATEKIRVLIVDDSSTIRLLLNKVLSADPQIVIVGMAERPSQVEELIQTQKPEVITLDINMPEMTGDEVTHALSLDPLTHDIPVIYLTSLLERGDTEVLDGTFGGHYGVSKSASLVELLQVIAKVMQ